MTTYTRINKIKNHALKIEYINFLIEQAIDTGKNYTKLAELHREAIVKSGFVK